ncbi:GNAT family N-acetyltransferase [Candidatus Pacearchaeota archaeon]|nr:GNAT family N-acetyltransferase [Candidatus Pacearchaeota archaeon]
MRLDFAFRSIGQKTIDAAISFIESHDLGYPNYGQWVDKAESELRQGIKQGIVAFSNGVPVGDIIFQRHKQVSEFMEIKNLRIHPKLRGRNFASFMLRQAELEIPKDAIILDVRADQSEIIGFLESQGYMTISKIPLYSSHSQDLVMIKLRNKNLKDKALSMVGYGAPPYDKK